MIGFCKDDFLGSILALLVINRTILLSFNRSKALLHISQSIIGFKTPDSIAAFATAGATTLINLGSNGGYNIITSKN
jgi:hypothetical protein